MDSRRDCAGDCPLENWKLSIPGMLIGVWLAAVAVRLVEWPAWRNSALWRDGSPLLPSPDTYAWLAGAAGDGRLEGWPMSELIAALSTLSGQSPEWVAFWLPLGLAGLPGLLLALLCAARGHVAAGWIAGILGASGLGYLARTRLGYTDTDLFALALAVALAWSWAACMQQLTRPQALTRHRQQSFFRLGTAAFVCWLFAALYPSAYPLGFATIAFGAAYGVWRGGPKIVPALLLILAALLMASHFGFAGLAGAWLLLGLFVFSGRVRSNVLPGAVLVVVSVAVVWSEMAFLEQTLRRIGAYTGLELALPPVQDWRLPGVEDSIAETTPLSAWAIAERMTVHWLLLPLGLGGFLLALRRWPELITFFPMLLLGLASFWLGPRFTMYAAPPLALGLALGLVLCLARIQPKPWQAGLTQGVAAAAIFLLIGWRALEPSPNPAVTPGLAQALQELHQTEARLGRVWTWWDHGYAVQHYAGLPTLADGGTASRQRIFALGQVFGARSTLQAAQVMKLGALARVDAQHDDWMVTAYQSHPLQRLSRMPAELAQAELDRLAVGGRMWPDGLPDEFLVVDWRTLRQAQWISYFGRWRLDQGEQGYGQIQTLQPPVELDSQRGLLQTPQGAIPLLSIDILETGSHFHEAWPRAQGAHAVINNETGEGVLMDSELYEQMAVQMLVRDPSEFEPYFQLISDQAPYARVYRVR